MKGRLRIHIIQNRMTYAEADTLSWYLEEQENVTEVKVYERTADAVICYKGEREEILTVLKQFSYEKAEVPETVLSSSGRQLNEEYKERLITKTVLHYGSKLFLPMPVRAVITSVKSVKYIWKGIRCLAHGRLEVPVLDATAISVSVFRKDFATAGSVMFLLGIGEIIEEWTHKKSVGDLARSMSLNVKKVWLKREDQEILVKSSEVQPGDEIIPTYYATAVDSEEEYEYQGNPYQYQEGDAISFEALTDGDYYYGFMINDAYGDYYITDYVGFNVEGDEVYYYTE